MDSVDAATSPAPPVDPVAPPVQANHTESNTPERPAENENPLAADMDTAADPVPPANQSLPETPVPAAPEAEPEPEPTPETTPQEADAAPEAPAAAADTQTPEQSQESEATQTQDAPPAPAPESTETPPPPPEEEPATWADIVEDTSSPDEEELKEIEAGRGDYSAMECKIYPV